uniref:EamA domain-containing protein n=1 Tax=viral metagenome TaxID=1070528 RepID=A0A6C0ENG6_9ZZZZ
MDLIAIEFNILLIAISLAVIYAIAPITYKLLVIHNNISFETYLLLSTFILFLCSLFYSLMFHNYIDILTEITKISSDLLLLIIINIFIVSFISQILFHYAIKHTSKLSLFTIITGFYPLITMILSILFLKEKISFKILFGFVISMIGIIIIFI